MKKIQKIMSKIVSVMIVFVIIAIIVCAYSVFSIKVLHKDYVNFFGYSIFEVATGSMREEINVGDAVLVKINDEYNVGDIVTYRSGDDYITHRVISKADGHIITKGDANNVNDNPVDNEMVLGRVIKVMPKVGVWKKVILTPKVIALILLTLFVFSILFSYDGNAIKIVSSQKAQKEIDDRIEDEVNKKVAVINRRKKRVRKVLDATQIIDLNEVNSQIKKANNNDSLEKTQILNLDEIDKKVEDNKKSLDATQILDLGTLNSNKDLEVTQILDLGEVNEKIKTNKKKKSLDATQILDLNEVNKKIETHKKKKKTLDATQIIDLSEIKRK